MFNEISNKVSNKIKSTYDILTEPLYSQVYKDKLSRHRLLFCIGSGRSGSNYLARLLKTAEQVTASHEPNPRMIGKYLDLVNKYPYSESFEERRRVKSSAVRRALHKLPEGEVYCETSHMFIKTFFDVVINDFQQIEVIILRRELALVLKSFIQLGYFSERNKIWQDWYTSPNAVTAALPAIAPDAMLDQYDSSIAYLLDIEARALRFQQEYPQIKVHNVRLETLRDDDHVNALFRDLRITPTDATRIACQQVVNHKQDRKETVDVKVSIDECRDRIASYLKKAEALDIRVPDTLALSSVAAI
jgi:hypothetical protein